MFHGFQPRFHKLKGKRGHKEEMECDFVLVFPSLIIAIECKSTLSENTFKKAMKQLDKLQMVLEEELGTGSNFRFIKCVAFQVIAENIKGCEGCELCARYLLRFENQEAFLSNITHYLRDTPLRPESVESGATFKAKVRDLLLFTSKKKNGGDAAARLADAYSTYHSLIASTPGKAVFFWNPTQYDIVKQNPQFCVIKGGRYSIISWA